jgi:hypothetical protein
MRHSVRASHRVRVRLLLTLACVIGTMASPAGALASGGSGVHVDPNSPVAKEYALPLATARGAPPESGQRGKLFGSGIEHPSSTSAQPVASSPPPAVTQTQTQTRTTASATAPKRPPAHHAPAHVTTVVLPALTTTRRPTASATPAAYRVLRPGSGVGVLWMIVAGVIVVALGSAGGVALRRRR